ncbi:Sperm-associated antigen 1 [Phytophthora ramorum]|uniref:Sperm-associated antigen 1 n=1 Tax=Phytophthora ramorum TaxID=164328 RepID=UPI0030AD8853|nr:Sperm-associated antigen 1 [Phytophthora ramorum]
MDPIAALDMEHRSGISQQEVDDFANRMDMIAKAMDDVKNGTFDPLKCNIPGYKTPEQEQQEREQRVKREQQQREREETRRRQLKQEERGSWWHKAQLRYSTRDAEEGEQQDETSQSSSERWANRLLAAYKARDANDYSLWDQWEPEDPVSLQEKAQREAELEKLRNREFESNNPEFCSQFKEDMEQRQRSQEQKARTAERLKHKGNRLYKKKQYDDAIKSYMEALSASPFNVAVLANIAQCYLRRDELDDCVEFCTRTLYVDENHVKALSRRATAWHRQKKLQEAADDMRKAFELDGENADIVEQHSIIVGDYEDAITNSKLEDALEAKGRHSEKSDGALSLGPSSIEELRFSLELFKKMDEQTAADDSQPEGQARRVKDAWVAYDLVLPFVERNGHVRAKFRTSGEMEKLCERILIAFDSSEANLKPTLPVSKRKTSLRARWLIVRWLQLPTHLATRTSLSWVVQASLARFLEEVVDSKSWRSAMILGDVLPPLFAALCLRTDEKDVPSDDRTSKSTIALAASSICFTLSSDSTGIQAFNSRGVDCLTAVAEALKTNRGAKSTALLQNLLGFMTNLSTSNALRKVIESNNCEETRRKLVQLLLQIAQDTYNGGEPAAASPKKYQCSERALGALLNLSFSDNSQVRLHDLVEFRAADTVEHILTQASPSTFTDSILILSRAASLLCRLHSACRGEDTAKGEVSSRLTSPEVLSKLYAVCEYANVSFSGKASVIPDELWQLCAQIWCHLGWCAHIATVRAFLRERNAVPLLTQVIALANAQKVYRRPTGETTACERLVGNIVKVLIAMQSDRDPADAQAFRKTRSLTVLVQALQELSDGLARKNVAILLAKLCQSDSHVKDAVRELRGIEMMLSVSRSLNQGPAALSR